MAPLSTSVRTKKSTLNISRPQLALVKSRVWEVSCIWGESNFYSPEKVKNFLKEAKLFDQLPLESQVTPEAKTHDQVRCVQLHNHISCLQSKDLAEKFLDKLRQRPGAGLGMLYIQKEQRRIVCMQKRRGEYFC